MSSSNSLESHSLFKAIWRHHWTKVTLVYLVVFLYATIGFISIEGELRPDLEIQDAIWWTFVTMTTVGYGDLFPETFYGRFFVAIPAMMVGIGIFGFIISELSATLVEMRSKKLRGMSTCKKHQHLIIINCQRVEVVKKLILEFKSDSSYEDTDLCLIDNTINEIPPDLNDFRATFIKGDPSKSDTLKRAGIEHAEHIVLLAPDHLDRLSDDYNLSTLLQIKSINPNVHTIVEAIDLNKKQSLTLAGADSVICSEEFSSNLAIQEIQDPGIKDILLRLTSNQVGNQLYLTSITNEQVTYKDLALWGLEHQVTILGFMRDQTPKLNPAPSTLILKSDKVILISNSRPDQINIS